MGPYIWGKEATQQQLIKNLDDIFEEVRLKYQLSEGDFPRLDEYKAALALSDISAFPVIDRKVLNTLQELLLKDIPMITSHVAGASSNRTEDEENSDSDENE